MIAIITSGCRVRCYPSSLGGVLSQTWVSMVMLSDTFTWQASLSSGFFFSFLASC